MRVIRSHPETGPATEPVFGDGAEQSALVTEFLAELRAFADEPPPQPSPELAALLGGATPISSVRHRHRHRRRNAVMAAAVGVAALSLTGVAAANESLPQPAQRVVSNVVNDFTPFHIDPSRLHPKPTPPTVPPAERDDHGSKPGDDGNNGPAGTQPSEGRDDGTSEPSRTETGGGWGPDGGSTESSASAPDQHDSPSPQPSEGGDHQETPSPQPSEGGDHHE